MPKPYYQPCILVGGPFADSLYSVRYLDADLHVPMPLPIEAVWIKRGKVSMPPTRVAVYRARRLDDRDPAGRVRMHFVEMG